MYDWGSEAFLTQSGNEGVVLTFDDGPSDESLTVILDTLHEYQVPALFFWQSSLLRSQLPVERMAAEGHVIGNHGVRHEILTSMTHAEQRVEIETSAKEIMDMVGRPVRLFRPPNGLFNADTVDSLGELGYKMVLWKVAAWDWSFPDDPERIVDNVVQYTKPGDIVLLHEYPQTAVVLRPIIEGLTARGLRFCLPEWAH